MLRKFLIFSILTCLSWVFSGVYAQDTYSTPGTGVRWNLDSLVAYSDGVLSKLNPEYLLDGEIVIAPSDTLELNPGSEVDCYPEAFLLVQGVLEAADESQKTWIALDSSDYFQGFRFEGEKVSVLRNMYIRYAKDFRVTGSNIHILQSHFISNGTPDELGFLNISQSGVLIDDCVFQYNEGAAVMSAANAASAVTVNNSAFIKNNVMNVSNVPQINLGTSGTNDTLKILHCTIEGEATISGGIGISTLAGGEINAIIEGNEIFNNRYGIAVYGNNIYAEITGNNIHDNTIQNIPMQGGSGLTVWGDASTEVKFRANTVRNNLWGLTLLNAPQVNAGDAEHPGNNTFQDNGNEGFTYNLYNNTPTDVSALYNYWGSADSAIIEEGIYHQADDASLGLVSYQPYLDFPVGYGLAVNAKESPCFFPNPAGEKLYRNFEGKGKVVFYSLEGKKQLEIALKNEKSFDIKRLPAGKYLLVFYGEKTNKSMIMFKL